MIRSTCISFGVAALALLSTPSPAAAQPGVLVGYNLANVNFDFASIASIQADPRSGFVGGFSYNQPVRDQFSVEFDALVAMKGTEFDFGGVDVGKAKLTYLDIPVLARGSFPAGGSTRVHVLAGPSFNFKLNASFEPGDDEDDDGTEAFETAIVVGGGVMFTIFRIDARWAWGLTNIIEESGDELTGKNRVFSLLFGVELR